MEIKEFNYAQKSIDQMIASKNLEEYEEHWAKFLHDLDRGWNKLVLVLSDNNEFKNVVDSIRAKRRDDPLLAYLMQARNCNEHTIYEITERVYGGSTRLIAGSGGAVIHRGTITGGKFPTDLVYSGNLKIEFSISFLNVVAVKNRGVTYEPPSSHIGTPITTRIPHELAKIGLEFYKQQFMGVVKFS
ncbi:MAG: hypothetical protein ACXWFG_13645 [Methylobacter sp.]